MTYKDYRDSIITTLRNNPEFTANIHQLQDSLYDSHDRDTVNFTSEELEIILTRMEEVWKSGHFRIGKSYKIAEWTLKPEYRRDFDLVDLDDAIRKLEEE